MTPDALELGFVNLIIVIDNLNPERIANLTTVLTKIEPVFEICLMDSVLIQYFKDRRTPFRVNLEKDIFERVYRLVQTNIEPASEPAVSA
jgi:hypothetical protein